MKTKSFKFTILSCCSMVFFILTWWLLTDGLNIADARILPSPITVVNGFILKFVTRVPDGGLLYEHILSSLLVSLTGYSLGVAIGIPLGILMAWSNRFDKFMHPIFNLFRPMPPIAWIPIFILWFGIGLAPKAAIVFIASFIPCLINAYEGIKRTNPVHEWVSRTFGATRNQVLFTVAIPTALPACFTGLRVALSSAWTSLVAAELLAATKGLGYMIQANRNLGNIDIVVVGMFTIGALGAILSYGLEKLEKKIVKGRNIRT